MSKRESRPNSKLIYKLIKQTHVKVEKVPSPSKPCGQARRKLKKTKEKLDLAYVLPTHKLEEEGRPYHFPSYTSSLNTQTNKKEKVHF
jgi:hypothetical protein